MLSSSRWWLLDLCMNQASIWALSGTQFIQNEVTYRAVNKTSITAEMPLTTSTWPRSRESTNTREPKCRSLATGVISLVWLVQCQETHHQQLKTKSQQTENSKWLSSSCGKTMCCQCMKSLFLAQKDYRAMILKQCRTQGIQRRCLITWLLTSPTSNCLLLS